MNLSVELRNTSLDAADMWMEPDAQGDNPDLAGGAQRNETRTTTWDSSTHQHTFRFHAFKPGLLRPADVELTIDGHEAHADNFSGFIVTWNGTTLNVVTK